MATNRRWLITRWGLWLLLVMGPAVLVGTNLQAQTDPVGTVDTSFGSSTLDPGRVMTDFRALPDGRRSTDVISAIAIQPDGKIVAAGRSNSPNGDDNFALVRYNPDGTIDTSFGSSTLDPGRVL